MALQILFANTLDRDSDPLALALCQELSNACIDVLANAAKHIPSVAERARHQLTKHDFDTLNHLVLWILTFESEERPAAKKKRLMACKCSLREEDGLTEFYPFKARRINEDEADILLRNFSSSLFRLLTNMLLRLESPVRAQKIKSKLDAYETDEIELVDRETKDVEFHGLVCVLVDRPDLFIRSCMLWFNLQHLPLVATAIAQSTSHISEGCHAKTMIQFPRFPALLIQQLQSAISAFVQEGPNLPTPSRFLTLHQLRILSDYMSNLFTNDSESPLHDYPTPHAYHILNTIHDIVRSLDPLPPQPVQEMTDFVLPHLLRLAKKL
ncbi:hypothetical protein BDV98DRAFT_589687 [Pterulicium gracile]|uniref:Uncharacterized protein n=1 Tax=Pterulicium gracile TaxID=1884261 RepID=A0A5C3QWP2_9AGAR|nr:hypothetical protein BDV98DRAFT_589687 [Pterula gracilis]